MIRLPNLPLPAQTAIDLAGLQAAVDGAGNYAARVAAGKSEFSRRNKAIDPVFRVVRATLDTMAGATRRCAYCEDSMADEVEHIAPKDLYPEKVFLWENYVYACGPCNGSNKKGCFKVFRRADRQEVDVTRKPRAAIVPPVDGDALFINQRLEDPMDMLELDLAGTFQFTPRHGVDAEAKARAIYTRDLLGLNRREALRVARRAAYVFFRSALESYDAEKIGARAPTRLAELEQTIRTAPHPTVWQEMRRKHDRMPDLAALFTRNPETLNW